MSPIALLTLVVAALSLATVPPAVLAQDEVTIPTTADGPIKGVVSVVAPTSRAMAVHDGLKLLAVGIGGPEPHVALYRLDAQGQPAATPHATFALPKPEPLKAFPHYATALAFHPRHAVLYVWQDLAGPGVGDPKANPVFLGFDHLLVLSVVDAQPRLIRATARGPEYSYGLASGSLALSPGGERLVVPGARIPPGGAAAMAYIDLDPAGYPLVEQGAAKIRLENVSAFTAHTFMGFAAFPSTVAFGSGQGVVVWDIENRRARLGGFHLNGGAYTFRLAAHPEFPAFYITLAGTPQIYRIDQVGGYPTLLPQRLTFTGAAFHGIPVVMPKRQALAIGGVNRLFVASLDARGRFMAEGAQMSLIAPIVQSMTYSNQFDKLYVAVEKLPDPPAAKPEPGKEKPK